MTGHGIRATITATALGVAGGALVISAALMLGLQHRSLTDQVDEQARLRLIEVVGTIRDGTLPASLAGQDDGTVAQIVRDGVVVVQSPVIRTSQPLLATTPAPGQVTARTVAEAPIGDDEHNTYRVVGTRVDTPSGPVIVFAAASLEMVNDSVKPLALILSGLVPGLILLVGATTWWLVGRTLRPVEAIRTQVSAISTTELDRRVPVPATADEIGRLARTMNEMLDRLDTGARRQRAFVADASHELRSPLAAIRTRLEVELARQGNDRWPEVVREWLDEQSRLERLVDDLLLLARMDERVVETVPKVVDLDELVLLEARDLDARGTVRVDVAKVGGGRVRGDRERLRRVVSNLLDNAERHAATTVACELHGRNGCVELVVYDDGPGIADGERLRVFERFVRLDEARDRRGGGTGLGLAIVRDIVTAHEGTVEAATTDRGARLVVRIPAADG
jgi:signal transduction histidine kinase